MNADYLNRILGVLGDDAWLLAGLAVAALAVIVWMQTLKHTAGTGSPAQAERDQSTAWAAPHDVRDMIVHPKRLDARRLVIGWLAGKMLAGGLYWSLLVIAPTRMGKTARVVVPIVLRHRGPALIASVKGDVRALTEHHRNQQGPVWVFDPTRADTARWSPLAGIHTWADALNAAGWIQESSKAGGGRDMEGQRFWDSQARKLLAPILLLTARMRGTMADMFETVASVQDDAERRNIAEELQHIDPDAATYWAVFTSLENKTRTSVLATASDVLDPWAHPDIKTAVNVTADDTTALRIADLLDRQGTLYLVAPASAQAQFTPVYATLTNAILREAELRHARTNLALDPPLLLMLDEAANIAPLRNLDRVASSMASMGVLVVTVWQSVAQLRDIYGHDKADIVLDNHSTKVYLGGISDPRTLDEVSRAIGHDVVQRTNGDHRTWVDIEVAPPDLVRLQQPGQGIAISGNRKPARVTLPGWYEEKTMRALVDPQVAEASDRQYSTKRPKRQKVTA